MAMSSAGQAVGRVDLEHRLVGSGTTKSGRDDLAGARSGAVRLLSRDSALGSNSTGPGTRSSALRIFGEPAELTMGEWLDSPQARRKSPSKV